MDGDPADDRGQQFLVSPAGENREEVRTSLPPWSLAANGLPIVMRITVTLRIYSIQGNYAVLGGTAHVHDPKAK